MQQSHTIVGNITVLQHKIAELTSVLESFNDKIGILECMVIIRSHLNVPELDNMIADMTNKLEAYKSISVLMQVTAADGKEYEIKLARTDKLITGEYLKIEELMHKMSNPDVRSLKENLELMQNRLILNSLKVYGSLRTAAKNTNYGRKFDGLMISKKVKYLYYYPVDKKKTLCFVAHEIVM